MNRRQRQTLRRIFEEPTPADLRWNDIVVNMLDYKGYIGTVEADDGVFIGRVLGLRDVITFEGETFAEVEQAFRDSIDDYLAFCAEHGEPPDRPYSGRIPLRIDPELHRRAARHAQAEGLSLNQWIARRIERVDDR